MILAIFLIFIGFLVCCFAWYIYFERGKGLESVGNFPAILLSIIAVGSLYFSSLRLGFSPLGQIGLIAGIYFITGLTMLFREMFLEGLASVMPRNLSDKLLYIFFLIALLVILILLIKVAYYSYTTGTIPRNR